ncbi:fenitrothion hydrolase [Patulibacter brassicae]|uniref:Fenitrothion hydrolase n=1 Tax=Patulibacter brassicae TaxID=1705717 RepID=A0ABU4VNV9_9ACTN|nr:fenitrothion hydrolase [Patulibacter brassicae]MDX8153314.1 fenitrothion hydrolase [Patulibacter brassicae]
MAVAHGLDSSRQLPLPEWLFAWAAAVVLVVSFVGLSLLWHRPRLADLAVGRSIAVSLPLRASGRTLLGALGLLIYGMALWAGLTGTSNPQGNLVPTLVFVGFWVGIPVLSVLVGDVWRALSPWRTLVDLGAWIARRTVGPHAIPAPLRYPTRLGLWPAAMVLLTFGWLELAAGDRDDPSLLAVLALLYGAAMLIGSGLYGREFLDRADGFARFFALAATLSPLDWRDGRLRVRLPGSGLADVRSSPGFPAVVLTLIGTTTFDGISGGELWTSDGSLGPWLEQRFTGLGMDTTTAATAAATVGLLLCVGLVTALVLLGIAGVRSVDRLRTRDQDLLGRFAPSLVPIALGYAIAHYLSLLAINGQALGSLFSDPRGDGSDLFGTAGWTIDYDVLSPDATWYLQVVALVGGHVAGLVAAHDTALLTFRGARSAVRSQYWMLAVMVAFTSLGLWLLS